RCSTSQAGDVSAGKSGHQVGVQLISCVASSDAAGGLMARTTVNVDESLLDQARAALGTEGLTETVNAALSMAARRGRLATFDIPGRGCFRGQVWASSGRPTDIMRCIQ